MRKRTLLVSLTLLATVFSASVLTAVQEQSQEVRTWTSRSGSTIDASFEKIIGSTIYLKTAAGKRLSIRLSALSDADQSYAKGLAATSAPKPTVRKLSSGLRRPTSTSGTLTSEQIAGLKTEWQDDKGKKFRFSGSFGMARMSSSDKRKYAKSGKVPVRITASLYELGERKGKTVYERLKGTGRFYVLDAEGNEVIKKKSSSLAKLCPS